MNRRQFLKTALIGSAGALIPMRVWSQPPTVMQTEMLNILGDGGFVLAPRRAGKSFACITFAVQEMLKGKEVHLYTLMPSHTAETIKAAVKETTGTVPVMSHNGFINRKTAGSIWVHGINTDRAYNHTGTTVVDEPDLMDKNTFSSLLAKEKYGHLCGAGTVVKDRGNLWQVRHRVVRVVY